MRLRSLLLLALLARTAAAQTSDTTHRAPGATVSGVVRDSIGHAPLAGAMVQLVAADIVGRFGQSSASDSSGQFTFVDVPEGRYTLGFFHPLLDSLGLEPTLREVSVSGRQAVRADLATPSPARLRAAICGPKPATESGGAVVGVVRDARDGAPAVGVAVTGEWLELSFGPGGVARRIPRLVATTGENGWFAMCSVPSGGTMTLMASRGADSTDVVEVQVPAEGFLRRELYLGPARTILAGGSGAGKPGTDSLALPPRRLRKGDGRLSGTVAAAAGRQPLVGAQVGIADGPTTRTDERGEWTLVEAPVGTRMLEVRAVGFYPERRRVDVVAGSAPIHVALSTLKSVLDTVKVTASRLTNLNMSGFQDRRRAGAGRYLTAEDIAPRHAIITSDLFRNMSGVRQYAKDDGTKGVMVRGAVYDWCTPAIYFNGHYINPDSVDIDDLVRPNEIAALEVYAGATAPPQFQEGLSGCGSIVIWTK